MQRNNNNCRRRKNYIPYLSTFELITSDAMFLAWIKFDGQIESIIIHGLKGENTVNCRDGNWEMSLY